MHLKFTSHLRYPCKLMSLTTLRISRNSLKKFFVGIFLGILASLVVTSFDIPCAEKARSSGSSKNGNDDFEPRIVKVVNESIVNVDPIRFQRPRYYSTELGVRKKLFVGIVSSSEILPLSESAMKTVLKENFDELAFFSSSPKYDDMETEIPKFHPEESEKDDMFIFWVIKIIGDKFWKDFDYIFLVKDSTYIRGDKLEEFVKQISVNQDVALSRSFNAGSTSASRSCSLDSGIIISHSAFEKVLRVVQNRGFKDANVGYNDELLSGVISHALGHPCQQNINVGYQLSFNSFGLSNDDDFGNLKYDQRFLDSTTVSSIKTLEDMYRIHIIYCEADMVEIEKSITKLQNEMVETNKKENTEWLPWPVGSEKPFKPKSRFDIIKWQYFNTTHMLFPDELTVLKRIGGSDKDDIENIINVAKSWLDRKYPVGYQFRKLVDGYRRFDPVRGMEYVMNLEYVDVNKNEPVIRHLEVFRGLTNLELIPVPFVTENVLITLITAVTEGKLEVAHEFLKSFAKDLLSVKGSNVKLILVLVHKRSSFQAQDPFVKLKMRIQSLNKFFGAGGARIRYMEYATLSDKHPPQLAIVDMLVRKLSPDSMVMFVKPEMISNLDFLKRVRMNTIQSFQVFFPVPFVQYDPQIVYRNKSKKSFFIGREYGHYDKDSYDFASFYLSDYVDARKPFESTLPVVRSDKDFESNYRKIYDSNVELIHLFLNLEKIHIFRAVDKHLLVKYLEIKCDASANYAEHDQCLDRMAESSGNQRQLASLYLEKIAGKIF